MNTIGSDPFAQDAANAVAAKRNDSLGQADFMRLMTEQLKHQDPLKPLSNAEFVGQLAQFSTVQGIADLNSTVQSFTSALAGDQVLRGAAVVGHNVLMPSTKIGLQEGETARGIVMAPGPGLVTVEIADASGTVVRRLDLQAQAAGELAFAWDGMDDAGAALAGGVYTLAARHADPAGAQTALSTYVNAKVESVTIGSDGLYLNLPLLGAAPIEYVLRIGGSS